MSSSQPRVAIITGASRGIGAVIAKQLAGEGFAVVINYASSAGEATQLVAQLREDGHEAIAVQADVSSADDVKRLFDEAEAQLGKVDVLINNAGVLKVLPLAQHSDELYEQTFNINTKGTFNTLREAATRLNGGGRIVNFSSSTVGMNLPGYAVYIASKAAVESLTLVFAKELRGRNHEPQVDAGEVREIGRRPHARVQRHAGQELRVQMLAVHGLHHLGLARPQQHILCLGHRIGESRAPCARTDYRDHAFTPAPRTGSARR